MCGVVCAVWRGATRCDDYMVRTGVNVAVIATSSGLSDSFFMLSRIACNTRVAWAAVAARATAPSIDTNASGLQRHRDETRQQAQKKRALPTHHRAGKSKPTIDANASGNCTLICNIATPCK